MKTFLRHIILLIAVLSPTIVRAQIYSDVYTFSLGSGFPDSNNDGVFPECALVLSSNVLYGTTYEGGSNGVGGVFSVHTDGTHFKNLHSFSPLSDSVAGYNNDGAEPFSTLVLQSNFLYGTAWVGGTGGGGTIFRINTDGTGFSNFYNFPNYEGAPRAGLFLSSNVLYGTAGTGGQGYGSVFRINTDSTHFTNLISFYPSATNLAFAPNGGVIVVGNKLFGVTAGSDQGTGGSIFSIGINGRGFTNFFYFQGVAGENQVSTNDTGGTPSSSLVLVGDMLYGTTPHGGTNGNGVIFGINTNGTGFTNMHTFSALSTYNSTTNSDGGVPDCQLLAIGNTLYGICGTGGPTGFGTLFSINTDGSGFTVVWDFPDILGTNYIDIDGAGPVGGLINSETTLYGTSVDGGYNGNVYALNLSTNSALPTLGFQASANSLTFTWDSSTYELQFTSFLQTAFTNLPNATSPYTVVPNLSAAFYRLVHK